MKHIKTTVLIFLILSFSGVQAAGWRVDSTTSSVGFFIKSSVHDVNGVFHNWSFSGDIKEDLTTTGELKVDVASIDTQSERRDRHLRNQDFFDVPKFPSAIFHIESVKSKDKEVIVKGILNIHGISKKIEIKFKKSQIGQSLILEGSRSISRKEFGISFQSPMNKIEDAVELRIKLTLTR